MSAPPPIPPADNLVTVEWLSAALRVDVVDAVAAPVDRADPLRVGPAVPPAGSRTTAPYVLAIDDSPLWRRRYEKEVFPLLGASPESCVIGATKEEVANLVKAAMGKVSPQHRRHRRRHRRRRRRA